MRPFASSRSTSCSGKPARRTALGPVILVGSILSGCGAGSGMDLGVDSAGSGGFPGSGGAPLGSGGAGTASGGSASGGAPLGSGGAGVASGGASSTGGSPSGSGGSADGSGGISSSGGAAGSGGASGSGGEQGCGVEPANPNTNATARKVLCYLHETYGSKVISGQQDCHWSASSDIQYIVDRSGGKYPAVIGGDFLYDNAVSQATTSWNAGGLSMIRYHMGRPLDADSYESSLAQMSTQELADTLTPGTARYNSLMDKFDHAASELQLLENEGVVVLWAPFHEVQQGGWFWWSQGSGDQLKALWTLMFDDFTGRGLDNLIWLFPFSGEPTTSFFPGASLVDLAGVDTYDPGQPFPSLYTKAVSVIGSQIPIPLHETGTIVNPDTMFQNNQAPWVLFSTWCDTQLRGNSDSAIAAAYASSYTISRADLPTF